MATLSYVQLLKLMADPETTQEARTWCRRELEQPELILQACAYNEWAVSLEKAEETCRRKLRAAERLLAIFRITQKIDMVQARADRRKASLLGESIPSLNPLKAEQAAMAAHALAEYRVKCSAAWAELRAIKAARPK